MLSQYGNLQNIRIVGFDDILNHDYITAFSNLRKKINGKIELCPENRYCSATAIAVEWILYGEQDIAVSFTGIGSKACLEEVMIVHPGRSLLRWRFDRRLPVITSYSIHYTKLYEMRTV